jgi:anti-anti-sigma regulatory factor
MPRAKPKHVAASSSKARRRKAAGASAEDRKIAAKTTDGAEAAADSSEGAPENAADAPLVLPDCLDASAASGIRDMLLARRGKSLIVDASQIRRVGAQSLQVLIAAARTWHADGQHYVVTKPSSELLGTISLIGLAREELQLEGLES